LPLSRLNPWISPDQREGHCNSSTTTMGSESGAKWVPWQLEVLLDLAYCCCHDSMSLWHLCPCLSFCRSQPGMSKETDSTDPRDHHQQQQCEAPHVPPLASSPPPPPAPPVAPPVCCSRTHRPAAAVDKFCINCWSSPRCCSTSLMYAFAQRNDTQVCIKLRLQVH
jgi:hypothetical protein